MAEDALMPRETEFLGTLNAAGTVLSIPVTAAVAAGKLVVVSAGGRASSLPSATASDTKGNTYTSDMASQNGTNGPALQFSSILTTALTTSDTIRVTYGVSMPVAPGVAGIYPEAFSGRDPGNDVDAIGNQATTANSAITTSPNTLTNTKAGLQVATINVVSAARTVTPAAGWSISSKAQTTSGTSDRSVYQMWRYVAAGETNTPAGTYNSSAFWGIVARGYGFPDVIPPGADGRLHYWNGTAWVVSGEDDKGWNGTAYVDAQWFGWNGTAYVEAIE